MGSCGDMPNHGAGEGSIDTRPGPRQREEVAREIMKTRLFLVCCAALALGSGCATYDTGGTADDTVVVTGSGDNVVVTGSDDRGYYEVDPYSYHSDAISGGYDGIPVRDLERGPAMWKQPSPNGQDWTDARPEFRFYYTR
jgi:hypothetical protein